MKNLILATLIILIGGAAVYLYYHPSKPTSVTPAVKVQPSVVISTSSMANEEILVENLNIPWDIVFLPDGEMLITERPGVLLKIGKDKKIIQINGVRPIGEGGLLGIILHPDFKSNRLLYLYLTTQQGGRLVNQVERYKLQGDSLTQQKVIISGILASSNHDGGRMVFGPDGYLYVTTGDAEQPNLAQDKNSLNGKILRVKDDGSLPEDNPFGNAVYSYGHRNAQGLAWDAKGNLWATEHGRSGALSGLDELNLIIKGQNYGWPVIQGEETRTGMVTPAINSGPNETWAPSGAVYYQGSIFFAGLRGQTLYQAVIQGNKVTAFKKYLQNKYGRLRTVKIGPDGYFYLLTNNTDGRGTPRPDDDRLIRINPKILQ